MCRTNSLRGEDLCEASREGDEDYRVSDPGQILQEHITVQTTVHPLLCCGHTHRHTKDKKQLCRHTHTQIDTHKQAGLNVHVVI